MPRVPDLFEHPDGTSTGDGESDRILTAPNIITTVRALCIPLFVYLLFARDSPAWAGIVLGLLGATDWIDGYVARRFNQTSTFANMAAFPWFLFASEPSWSQTTQNIWTVLAYCAAIPGVIFSLLAAGQYVTLGRQAIAEGRA